MTNWIARTNILFFTALMFVTAGCTGDATDGSKQFNLSAIPVQREKEISYYADTVTNKLISFYVSTVSFLTNDCGVGSNSLATSKAVFYGVGGGLFGRSKGSLYGLSPGDRIEGLVFGSIIGSGVGLAVGVKESY